MTTEELRNEFSKFGFGKWPDQYEVDADTYANVCQTVFENCPIRSNWDFGEVISINIGPNKGLMFRNVELIKK